MMSGPERHEPSRPISNRTWDGLGLGLYQSRPPAGHAWRTLSDPCLDAYGPSGMCRLGAQLPSPSFRAKLILVAFSQVRACAGGLSAYDLTAGRPALESEDLV